MNDAASLETRPEVFKVIILRR